MGLQQREARGADRPWPRRRLGGRHLLAAVSGDATALRFYGELTAASHIFPERMSDATYEVETFQGLDVLGHTTEAKLYGRR